MTMFRTGWSGDHIIYLCCIVWKTTFVFKIMMRNNVRKLFSRMHMNPVMPRKLQKFQSMHVTIDMGQKFPVDVTLLEKI